MVGVEHSEMAMDGIEGASSVGASLTKIEGGFGTLIVGMIGAEAVDGGI